MIDAATGREEAEGAETVVHFRRPGEVEIAAYVATGEPLRVTGAFTLDGYGGWTRGRRPRPL